MACCLSCVFAAISCVRVSAMLVEGSLNFYAKNTLYFTLMMSQRFFRKDARPHTIRPSKRRKVLINIDAANFTHGWQRCQPDCNKSLPNTDRLRKII